MPTNAGVQYSELAGRLPGYVLGAQFPGRGHLGRAGPLMMPSLSCALPSQVKGESG